MDMHLLGRHVHTASPSPQQRQVDPVEELTPLVKIGRDRGNIGDTQRASATYRGQE
jgi:hypothetical protein